MKLGRFINLLSAAYGVDEKTVKLFCRNLREAGLMTSGARGRNAPDMTPTDLAVVTIALLATDAPSRAVEEFNHFANLQPWMSRVHNDEYGQLGKDHRLLDAVKHLCDPETNIPGDTMITFKATRDVTISRDDERITYQDLKAVSEFSSLVGKYDDELASKDERHQAFKDLSEFKQNSPAFFSGGIRIQRALEAMQINLLKEFLFGALAREVHTSKGREPSDE